MTTRLGVILLAGPENGGTYQYTLSTLQALRHTRGFDITLYGDPSDAEFARTGYPIKPFAESRRQQLAALTVDRLGVRLRDPFAGEDILLAPIYSIHPAMGQEIITPAFVVVVIGGLGSFWGVVVAALMVGLVKGVTIGLGYTQWSTAVIYLMMLLVLLFRPRGLFGERIQRFE